ARRRGVFAMTTNVLIGFYSTYGHIHRMALAVAEGAESVPDSTVRLRRIAELEEARKALSAQDAYVRAQQAHADIPVVTHDDLRGPKATAGGPRTGCGSMSTKMRILITPRGGFGLKGRLEDRPTRRPKKAKSPATDGCTEKPPRRGGNITPRRSCRRLRGGGA